MKIVILILSTRTSAYDGFKDAIRKTWLADSLDHNIPCYFYEGGWSKNEIVGDTIRLKTGDSLAGTYDKFIDCLNFLTDISLQYDVVFRTNLSSYIDILVFLSFIEGNSLNERSYEGVRGKTYLLRERMYLNKYVRRFSRFALFGEKIQFVSGAGLFLGAEATAALLSYDGPKNNFNIIEDVKIGWILHDRFPSVIEVKRLDIFSSGSHKLSWVKYLDQVQQGLFHYKLKNKDRQCDQDNLERIHDIEYRESLCIRSDNEGG